MEYLLGRQKDESDFEWKLRLCLAKKRHLIDNDWSEIVELLNLEITPDQLRKQAVGYYEYDEYLHGESGASEKILCISDAHVPFNLPVTTFADYSNRVDTLIFNGDIEDCFSVSSFSRKYRVGLDEEMALTRQYIIDTIDLINPKKVIFITGNHEKRLQRHLSDKLNEDLLSIMPQSTLDLIIDDGFYVNNLRVKARTYYPSIREIYKNQNIEIIYDGNWYYKEGKVLFVHPLSYSSGMLKTTEKAVDYFLRIDRDFTSLVMSHTHKLGSYTAGGIQMYEQGCCCDLEQLDYNNGKLILPNQNGFIYMYLDSEGKEIVNKTKLISF